MTEPDLENGSDRLPLILHDVKLLLTDILLADVHGDTLEVVYGLERIFDLLSEAEQLDQMTPVDREEFERFETGLIDIYSQRLVTIEKTTVTVNADNLRSEISAYMEPVEIEVGTSRFTVIDDREGHIPVVYNQRVEQAIQFFQTRGREQFGIWLAQIPVYGDMIGAILRERDLPEELLYLALIESGLNPRAYSRASAVGMWQFIYATATKYGLRRTWWVDERRDPVKSTLAATRYLEDLNAEFDNWYLALAAYNSGEGRIRRAVRLHQTNDYWQLRSLPRETRNYIPLFLAAAIISRDPGKYGFTPPTGVPLEYDEVVLEQSADLNVLARSAGIPLAELRKYNPELRQFATPTNEAYALKIPKGRATAFQEAYSALPASERFVPEVTLHRVQRGETLWDISRRYRISIHELAAINQIRNRHRIKEGQKLTIPIPGSSLRAASVPRVPEGFTQITYVVKKGDTLGHIAENYRTRASKIRRWNGLNYGEYIYPGQKLVLWIPEG